MEGMERVIPKSIDYQDVLPVSVPAIARRRRFFPQNGSTFDFLGSNEIRIEIGSVNALLDPAHSYLQFDVFNTSAAQTIGFDMGGAAIFFDEVRVEQGGRVLAQQQAFNRLHSGILTATQESLNGTFDQAIRGGTRSIAAGNGFAGMGTPVAAGGDGDVYAGSAHNLVNQVPATAGMRFSMPMPTGLFTQDKLIPLPLVRQDSPITLVFRITDSFNAGAWSAVVPQNTLSFQQVNYVAQLIEVGGDVIEQMKVMRDMMGGQLVISGQDIEHTAGVLPANSAGEQPIHMPLRKRSMNSLLFNLQSDDYTNGPAGFGPEDVYNLSFGGCANMDSYQLKVGSVVYPPTPVNVFGNTAAGFAAGNPASVAKRSEALMELSKALGSLGFVNPTGNLNTLTYCTNSATGVAAGSPEIADGDNGDGAGPPGNANAPGPGEIKSCAPFGLDLTSFQHHALEAGIDSQTMSQDSNLILNIAAVTSGIENKTVNMYVIYDQHYYFNRDGMITFSN